MVEDSHRVSFIPSGEIVGLFQFLEIMTRDAVRLCTRFCVNVIVMFLRSIPRSGIAGSHGTCLSVRNCRTALPRGAPFCFAPSNGWVTRLSSRPRAPPSSQAHAAQKAFTSGSQGCSCQEHEPPGRRLRSEVWGSQGGCALPPPTPPSF